MIYLLFENNRLARDDLTTEGEKRSAMMGLTPLTERGHPPRNEAIPHKQTNKQTKYTKLHRGKISLTALVVQYICSEFRILTSFSDG